MAAPRGPGGQGVRFEREPISKTRAPPFLPGYSFVKNWLRLLTLVHLSGIVSVDGERGIVNPSRR